MRLIRRLQNKPALQYGKDAGLDMVTIIPTLVSGSSITPSVPFSVEFTLSLLTRSQQSIETLKIVQMTYSSVPLVHVDDDSNAHIFLMKNPRAHDRYIYCAINICIMLAKTEPTKLEFTAQLLKIKFSRRHPFCFFYLSGET